MKSYTDLEQSKKLAEILPIKSADMYYCYGMDIHTKGWSFDDTPTIINNSNHIDVHADIPCWSLASLLCRLPFPVLYMEMVAGMILWCCECHFIETDEVIKIEHCDNPIDACYDMILKLHELNLL